MVRHLHDLCALREHIANSEEEFARTAADSFEPDQQLQIRRIDMPIFKAALEAHRVICEDTQYAQEYEQFVSAMSYADEGEQISFDQASAHFREIADLIS